MNSCLKLFKKAQDIINGVIGVILIAIMCVVLIQTFTRYVIFYSIPWSEELSRYLFVILIMLGINIGISKNMMVRIDLIDNMLTEKGKLILEICREIISLVIASIFLYSSTEMVRIGAFQKSPALQMQMNIIYSFLFIGFVLAVVAVLIRIFEIVKKR